MGKKLNGEKELKDFTVEDVKSLVAQAAKMREVYLHVEDKYSSSACAWLSGNKKHPGGGRITLGKIMNLGERGNVFEWFRDPVEDVICEDYEGFCERVHGYIVENYHE